ncbi:MAG: ABC transporter permease [Methanomassiliicoccales archaeon]|nr:ABC transporter permease [Methanomassiliicoccales archaeon]
MKLGAYIIRRLLLLLPVLLGVSVFIFTLTRIGGNPAAAYMSERMTPEQVAQIYEKFHLNEPIYVQYWYWLDGILHGDWGYSKVARAPVTTAIGWYFPATAELAIISMIIAVVVGIALGTISAVKRDTPVDHATRVIALSGVSLPIFWLGLILQYVFFYKLQWFPSGGRYDALLYLREGPIQRYTGFWTIDTLLSGNLTLFGDALMHLALPAITLSFGTIAIITRIMRSSMLEVLNQDYIKTARSKGLPEKTVIKKHARKNALIPTTTIVGLSFGGLLGGAVLTETIFSWPGMGQWSTAAITMNDWASIMGFVLVTALIYVIANLVVDILYAFLDPRVRLG